MKEIIDQVAPAQVDPPHLHPYPQPAVYGWRSSYPSGDMCTKRIVTVYRQNSWRGSRTTLASVFTFREDGRLSQDVMNKE